MLNIGELQNAFSSIDTNNDNSVSQAELLTVCQNIGFATNSDQIGQFFSAIDTNNDGQISFEEFLVWYKNQGKIASSDQYKFQVRVLNKFKRIKNNLPEIAAGDT